MTVAARLARLCSRTSEAAAALTLLVAISVSGHARAEAPAEPPTTAATVASEFPKRLAITIVANERLISTFAQRVSSWFTDDTQVGVTVTSEVDLEQVLSADPSEVRAWVVPLSAERALVTFSSVTQGSPARHLVREVPLHEGLDEIGQERLASVIHSAFVALREGADGIERAQAERALDDAGLSHESHAPPAEFAAPPAPSGATANFQPILPTSATPSRPPARREPAAWLLLGAGYGARLRGSEGIGQGPSLALGAQLQTAIAPVDLLVSGQYAFRSSIDTQPFEASVQTSALRAHIGVEPALNARWSLQALLGAGADIAWIRARPPNASAASVHATAHANGTQWRGATELSAGALWHSDWLDLGVYALLTLLVEDVHYSLSTDQGEQRVAAPWRLQPGLLLQGRFRTAL